MMMHRIQQPDSPADILAGNFSRMVQLGVIDIPTHLEYASKASAFYTTEPTVSGLRTPRQARALALISNSRNKSAPIPLPCSFSSRTSQYSPQSDQTWRLNDSRQRTCE